jgi:hypothetical protein
MATTERAQDVVKKLEDYTKEQIATFKANRSPGSMEVMLADSELERRVRLEQQLRALSSGASTSSIALMDFCLRVHLNNRLGFRLGSVGQLRQYQRSRTSCLIISA